MSVVNIKPENKTAMTSLYRRIIDDNRILMSQPTSCSSSHKHCTTVFVYSNAGQPHYWGKDIFRPT